MLARLRKSLDDKEQGFTLIELLVVIIIIGILAAIAIPTFLRQREKGWDAASKAELKNIATALESRYTDTGAYEAIASNADPKVTDADPTVGVLKAEGYNISKPFAAAAGDVVVDVPAAGQYCIQVTHESIVAPTTWTLRNTGANAGSPFKGVAADAC